MSFLSVSATTSGPCACCGVGGVVMSCRTRGGTAALCGFPEWVNPSLPAKSYRTVTVGGSYHQDRFLDSGCSISDGSFAACTWSGACVYSGVDCSGGTGGIINCGGADALNCGNLGGDFGIGGDITVDQTLKQAIVTGLCRPTENAGQWGKYITANQFAQLSDEDLESDAITRLLAGPGGTWSAYTPVGDGSGGTCDPHNCCKALYQQRTTGFTFGYQESQYQAVMTLLDPTTAYVATFQVYRRLQGSSDPWVLLLESSFGFTTDGSGSYTIADQDVPNLEGYETYVCCPLVYLP